MRSRSFWSCLARCRGRVCRSLCNIVLETMFSVCHISKSLFLLPGFARRPRKQFKQSVMTFPDQKRLALRCLRDGQDTPATHKGARKLLLCLNRVSCFSPDAVCTVSDFFRRLHFAGCLLSSCAILPHHPASMLASVADEAVAWVCGVYGGVGVGE